MLKSEYERYKTKTINDTVIRYKIAELICKEIGDDQYQRLEDFAGCLTSNIIFLAFERFEEMEELENIPF